MVVSAQSTIIGFVGLGVMGKSMVSHLLKGGYKAHVYNRTKAKAEDLMKIGATWQDSPEEVAKVADVIITIVGYPADVEEIYFGNSGILESAKEGGVVIDMTTSSPDLAVKIYSEAKSRGISALDAPVSGGDIGARDGKLSIMVGGDKETYEKVRPLFELMGENIVFQGKAGSGQHCKMANQIAIASNIMGVCESIRYAEKAGLDPSVVLQSIAAGAAASWSLSNLAPRMLKGDFDPGFYIKHFIKDMGIAIDSAEKLGLEASGLVLAKSLYDKLAAEGKEDLGTQALYTHYK
jgi:3-hydroxyisobutyrate dehydrogenase